MLPGQFILLQHMEFCILYFTIDFHDSRSNLKSTLNLDTSQGIKGKFDINSEINKYILTIRNYILN